MAQPIHSLAQPLNNENRSFIENLGRSLVLLLSAVTKNHRINELLEINLRLTLESLWYDRCGH